jgi:hypothetical protein
MVKMPRPIIASPSTIDRIPPFIMKRRFSETSPTVEVVETGINGVPAVNSRRLFTLLYRIYLCCRSEHQSTFSIRIMYMYS